MFELKLMEVKMVGRMTCLSFLLCEAIGLILFFIWMIGVEMELSYWTIGFIIYCSLATLYFGRIFFPQFKKEKVERRRAVTLVEVKNSA